MPRTAACPVWVLDSVAKSVHNALDPRRIVGMMVEVAQLNEFFPGEMPL
jgi:hypothetical protein